MSKPMSDRQLALLRVLWERGEATVAEVQEGLRGERHLALTTVATMLSRLEKQGVVTRRSEGRQFVYRAAVDETEVRKSMVSALMDRLFEGDPTKLVNHLIDEGDFDARQLARLEEILAEGKGKRRRGSKRKGGRRGR